MAPIVLPDIVRYTVNQRYASRPVANIVDMYLDDADLPQTRSELLVTLAGDILESWNQRFMPILSSLLVAESVSWVDLDTLDGSTGVITSSGEVEWPTGGGEITQGMPGMVAARIDKNTTGGRRARRGRMYLAGVPEAYTDNPSPNTLSAGAREELQDAADGFLDDLTTGLGPLLDICRPVVVHDPVDAPPSYTDVTGYSVRALVGRQGRRSRA